MSGTILPSRGPPLASHAVILPVGCLWGAGLALWSPTHHTVEIVTGLIFLVTGSVVSLAHKPVLQAANFHYAAILLALYCVAHGTFSYSKSLNLNGENFLLNEVVSRLRDYAAMIACISSVLVASRPHPIRAPQADTIDVEREGQLFLDAAMPVQSVNPGTEDSRDRFFHSEKREGLSDTGSIVFLHVGLASTPSVTTDSSEISLPSHGQVNQAFAAGIIQLSQTVCPVEINRDERDSTIPQVDLN